MYVRNTNVRSLQFQFALLENFITQFSDKLMPQ